MLAAVALVLMGGNESHDFLAKWWHHQVVRSLQGVREQVISRLGQFKLLWGLAQDLAPPAAIAATCVYLARRNAPEAVSGDLRPAARFALLTAMSASLPIMISPKQTGYYAAPRGRFIAWRWAYGRRLKSEPW